MGSFDRLTSGQDEGLGLPHAAHADHAPGDRAIVGRPRVVLRMPDFVGEVVMSEPMVRLLVASGLQPVVFGRPQLLELLTGAGLSRAGARGGRDEVDDYRASGARWGVAVRTSFRTALLIRAAGLRTVGRRGNLRAALLHHALPRSVPGHRVDELLDLGRATAEAMTGAQPPRVPPVPTVTATRAQVEEARRRLQDEGIAPPYVVCCPTARHAIHRSHKLWPAFSAFMARLVADGVETVACPTRMELSWYTGFPDGVRVLRDVDLGCLVGILAGAASVVSNDTGPAHLGSALGRPTLTLFGDTDPSRYAPRGPRAVVLGALGSWPSLDNVRDAWRRMTPAPVRS